MTIPGLRPRPAPRRGNALDRLTHGVPVAALLLLVVNDHVLKPNHPGWVSGKLSDVAVLALLPFLLLAVADLAAIGFPRLPAPGRTALLVSVAFTVVLFTAIEIVPIAGDAYRWGLGLAQWPVRAVMALLAAGSLPGIVPVQLTFDPSDLLTLPAATLILFLALPDGQTTTRVAHSATKGEEAAPRSSSVAPGDTTGV